VIRSSKLVKVDEKMKLIAKIKELWWMLFCLFLIIVLFWTLGSVLLEIHNWGFQGVLEGKFWIFLGEEVMLIGLIYVLSVCVLIKLIF
jgi:hypothetical protein